MKIADPERGFRKMREDIRRRREQQESVVNQPQAKSQPINNNYSNINSRPLQDDSDHLQRQINNLQQQINTFNRPQANFAPIQQPPAPLPVQQPAPQVVHKPKEQVSLTGLGVIALFLTGVLAYLYKINILIQNTIDSTIAGTPITANLLFLGLGVLAVCMIIGGLFKR